MELCGINGGKEVKIVVVLKFGEQCWKELEDGKMNFALSVRQLKERQIREATIGTFGGIAPGEYRMFEGSEIQQPGLNMIVAVATAVGKAVRCLPVV